MNLWWAPSLGFYPLTTIHYPLSTALCPLPLFTRTNVHYRAPDVMTKNWTIAEGRRIGVLVPVLVPVGNSAPRISTRITAHERRKNC